MAKQNQSGFTLIEVTMVLAIGSMLFVIAFAGQRGVRSRALFDAAVTKVMASVTDARNEATAAVNIVGKGDGTDKCPGGTDAGDPASERYVFAGTAWTADNALSPRPFKMSYYKAKPGNIGCNFMDSEISLPTDMSVAANYIDKTASAPAPGAPIPPSGAGARILYVKTNSADLAVCLVGLSQDETLSFRDGGCTLPATKVVATASLMLTISDSDGHTAHVDIDPSGFPKRRD